ncbi:DNA polymerase I, partial [Escherichia coli]
LEELQLGPIDKESLLAVYRKYELRNLIKELESGGEESAGQEEAGDDSAAPVAAIETDYRCILDEAEFDGWLEQLKVAPLFAFDTETTSLDYMEARIVGVSFAVEAGKAAYVPFGHDYLGAPVQLTEAVVLG